MIRILLFFPLLLLAWMLFWMSGVVLVGSAIIISWYNESWRKTNNDLD